MDSEIDQIWQTVCPCAGSVDLVGEDLVETIAVILESHSTVRLNVLHIDTLIKIHHKLPFWVDLHRERGRGITNAPSSLAFSPLQGLSSCPWV